MGNQLDRAARERYLACWDGFGRHVIPANAIPFSFAGGEALCHPSKRNTVLTPHYRGPDCASGDRQHIKLCIRRQSQCQTVHPATRRRPKRCLVDVGCTVWPACCRQRHSLARTPHPPHGIRRARDPSTPLAFARSARDDTWPPQAPQRSVLTRGPRRSGRSPKPAPLPSNPAGRGEPRVRAPSQQRPLVGGPPSAQGRAAPRSRRRHLRRTEPKGMRGGASAHASTPLLTSPKD